MTRSRREKNSDHEICDTSEQFRTARYCFSYKSEEMASDLQGLLDQYPVFEYDEKQKVCFS